jgi:hypothetical protein
LILVDIDFLHTGGYNGVNVQRQQTTESDISVKSFNSSNNNTHLTENMNSARLSSVSDQNSARQSATDEQNKQNLTNTKNLNRQGTYTSPKSLNPLKTPPVQSREMSMVSTATVSSSHSSVSYSGKPAKKPGKLKGGSISDTRRRIANILGRK